MKTSQTTKLLALLSDGLPHRTDEIQIVVYGRNHLGSARIGARIADIKALGHEIKGWKDDRTPSLYWYKMVKCKTNETHPPEKENSAPPEQKTFQFSY